ncbi:MAG: paraslipin, partial [Phormidesmis sp.]
LEVISKRLKNDPTAREALQFILAQDYLNMSRQIGESDSSKVMFLDPRSIPGALESMKSIVGDAEVG